MKIQFNKKTFCIIALIAGFAGFSYILLPICLYHGLLFIDPDFKEAILKPPTKKTDFPSCPQEWSKIRIGEVQFSLPFENLKRVLRNSSNSYLGINFYFQDFWINVFDQFTPKKPGITSYHAERGGEFFFAEHKPSLFRPPYENWQIYSAILDHKKHKEKIAGKITQERNLFFDNGPIKGFLREYKVHNKFSHYANIYSLNEKYGISLAISDKKDFARAYLVVSCIKFLEKGIDKRSAPKDVTQYWEEWEKKGRKTRVEEIIF